MNLPTLYKKTKTGKIQCWTVWTRDDAILTKHGQMDGKQQLISKSVEGKNIGKSNETTPEEQAILEAESMYRHRLDKGYFKSVEEAENETVFLPMLATDYTKLRKPLQFPVQVQPKLDGVRCMAYWDGDSVRLMSRGGKDYDVAHISDQLSTLLPKNAILDGELYVHGEPLQTIVKLVKKHRPGEEGSVRLIYQTYDILYRDDLEATWETRLQNLWDFSNRNDLDNVTMTATFDCLDEESLFERLTIFEDLGFEGAIIRTLTGKYTLGHRSRDLLKLKNFQDDEYEIVGFTEGKGIDKGTVIWQCVTPEGNTFGVRPKGTRDERKKWFDNAADFMGRKLTVKYQALTKDKVPQFPIGIAVRDYE